MPSGGADSHAGRHSENPDKILSEIATGHGTDERGLAYLNTGGEARVSKDGDWSETSRLQSLRLAPQSAGDPRLVHRLRAVVFKDFTTPLRVENPVPRVNQKGLRHTRPPEERGVLRLSVLPDRPPDGSYLRPLWPVR